MMRTEFGIVEINRVGAERFAAGERVCRRLRRQQVTRHVPLTPHAYWFGLEPMDQFLARTLWPGGRWVMMYSEAEGSTNGPPWSGAWCDAVGEDEEDAADSLDQRHPARGHRFFAP